MKLKSEEELAAEVIEWLQDYKWDVYQEIQLFSGSKIADIVAVQNRIVWIIETKLAQSLQVIEQAGFWKYDAHYVSVAVPHCRNSYMFDRVLEWQGIGKLVYNEFDGVFEKIKPCINRHAKSKNILSILTEEHKTFAKAGNNRGARLTPFGITCRNIAEYVRNNQGVCLKDLIASVKTHYKTPSTARACISQWAQAGEIKGVSTIHDGNKLRFYSA